MPGLTFTAPAHYDAVRSRATPDPARDPHDLPTFSFDTAHPTLYLPPLLSSLPESYPAPPRPIYHSALSTETRLPDIDPTSLSLHRALHHFRPVDGDYAARPYNDAFNWNELELPAEDEREWYCVAFRSLRKDGSDGSLLYEADKAAHEEAVQNGGLIMYWFGVPSLETGRNLATCIWQSRQHAIMASRRPEHVRAAKLTKAAYELYELECWIIRKVKGETCVKLEPYAGGPVGW